MLSSLQQHKVALIAMPGGGKSTLGWHLAQIMNVPFFDTDALIEQQIGMSIKKWFEQKGEQSFRDIEQNVIARQSAGTNQVLATGGGAILREINRLQLQGNFTVFYLHSSPGALYRRLRYDKTRPLLQVSNPLQRLEQLYQERDPLYRQTADFVLETGRLGVQFLVNKILMQLELSATNSS